MGRLLVIGFVGSVLLGLAALIALLGLEGGAGGNNFVPGGTTAANLPELEPVEMVGGKKSYADQG